MKEKVKKYLWVIIIMIIVGGCFYWYEWRPNQIKQRCYAEAEFDRRAVLEFGNIKRQEFINMYYENCLIRFGLEK